MIISSDRIDYLTLEAGLKHYWTQLEYMSFFIVLGTLKDFQVFLITYFFKLVLPADQNVELFDTKVYGLFVEFQMGFAHNRPLKGK